MGFWALELYKLDPTGQPRKPDPNERFPTSLRNHRLLPSVVYEPILAAMPEFVVWLPGLCRALEGPAQTGGLYREYVRAEGFVICVSWGLTPLSLR